LNLAIISDIHGNSYALDQVLARIDAEGIDRIVCLGDVALSGFDPKGSIERLVERGIPTVRGNTDGRILADDPYQPADPAEASRERDWMDWTLAQLGHGHLAALNRLPGTIDLEIEEWRITAYHGSPKDYFDPVLPSTPPDTLERWFEETSAQILLGGHTHQQMLRRWNGRSIVNPGPVSLNPEKLPAGARTARPWAEFAVLTLRPGAFECSFRYVPIDLDQLERHAHASGLPHVEAWLAEWSLGS
jgi:putative phosphoesterase